MKKPPSYQKPTNIKSSQMLNLIVPLNFLLKRIMENMKKKQRLTAIHMKEVNFLKKKYKNNNNAVELAMDILSQITRPTGASTLPLPSGTVQSSDTAASTLTSNTDPATAPPLAPASASASATAAGGRRRTKRKHHKKGKSSKKGGKKHRKSSGRKSSRSSSKKSRRHGRK